MTGKDDRAHCLNLEEVLRRLKEQGLRLKKNKCQFLQPSVKYLGYEIDAAGLHTAPEKVKAVKRHHNLKTRSSFVHFWVW